MGYKILSDSIGEIKVPVNKLWGAQTQRSLQNFKIGSEKMPSEIIHAIVLIKKAAAKTNKQLKRLDTKTANAISLACDKILAGGMESEFPLAVWQTGSGTQTNMNANEVISTLAHKLTGTVIHPNDHVNKGQSSNDVFPSAMHIAAVLSIEDKLLPALQRLCDTFNSLANKNTSTVKIGRTHLQDAVPLTFGQEVSAWQNMLKQSIKMIESSLPFLRQLAIGGTAVGSGLNTHPEFGKICANKISLLTSTDFVCETNKFHAMSSKDALAFAHGALNSLAANLMKIANDIRWLASGPRCGLGEISLPENEPGSSIMPGKVNPTQCEALTMVCVQIMGNHTSITFAASQGNFQLNVFMPLIAYNFSQSVQLLSDATTSFDENCAKGIQVNGNIMRQYLENSLMLVTALNPYIGYEKSAKIAQYAHDNSLSLKQAAIKLNLLTSREFDEYVNPDEMTVPK